jgi:peptide/nickel transport system permease protein
MLAVGIVYIPQYARLARSSVLSVKDVEYIEAARAVGAWTPRILWRHVLPNIVAPLLVQATLGIAITLLVLGFNLLGDGLRDALDPTQT